MIAGVLDGADAVIFYGLALGVTPTALFQGIASGLLGSRSFHGGLYTTVLGIGLHFSIAFGAAAVFYAASLFLPALFRKPFLYGPLFGLAVYLFMYHVVLPLSAVHPRSTPRSTLEIVDLLVSHTLFVGLPIALMARRSARVG